MSSRESPIVTSLKPIGSHVTKSSIVRPRKQPGFRRRKRSKCHIEKSLIKPFRKLNTSWFVGAHQGHRICPLRLPRVCVQSIRARRELPLHRSAVPWPTAEARCKAGCPRSVSCHRQRWYPRLRLPRHQCLCVVKADGMIREPFLRRRVAVSTIDVLWRQRLGCAAI